MADENANLLSFTVKEILIGFRQETTENFRTVNEKIDTNKAEADVRFTAVERFQYRFPATGTIAGVLAIIALVLPILRG